MNILIVPMYSRAEINGDSNYVVYAAWLRAAAAVRPGWTFVVLFPDAKSGFSYADDGTFGLPNVERVPYRVVPRKRGNAVAWDAAWVADLFRRFTFDVVWCHLVEEAGHWSAAAPAGVPVVAQHHYSPAVRRSIHVPVRGSMANLAVAQALPGVVPGDQYQRLQLPDHAGGCGRRKPPRYLK